MKTLSNHLIASLAGAAALMGATAVHAAATDWVPTSGTADWNTSGNWSSGVPAASGTANLTATLTAAATADLSAAGTTGILNIASGNAFLMRVTGTNLTMDNGGAQAQINIGNTGGVNNDVIQGVPILMTSGGLAITLNNTTNRGVTGGISSAVSGTQTLTLTTQNTGNLAIKSAISNGSGTVAVVAESSGLGVVVLSSTTSAFSGGLTIRRGSVSGLGLGTGLVTMGDAGSTGAYSYVLTSGTVANDFLISNLATSGAASIIGSTTQTFTGDFELQKDLTGERNSTPVANVTLSGAVSGTGTLILNNTGNVSQKLNLTLSGVNSSHSGGITLNSTTGGVNLILGSATALGTGTLTIGASNTSLDSTQANLVLTTNNAVAMNGDITYVGTGGNNLDLGTGTVTFSGNKSITVTNGVLTIGGAVVSGGTLTKEGAGTLVLNGANTYASDTTVSAGTLRGTGSVAAGLYVESGATLEAGNGIGTFTAGGEAGFLNGGTFKFELNSTNETYDQLVADGLSLDSSVTFSIDDLGSGTWVSATPFVIINNTSGSAVSGTFSGYAEGSSVDFGGGNVFKISYVGGTGNDVTLTLVPEPGTWLLATAGLAFTLLRRRRS